MAKFQIEPGCSSSKKFEMLSDNIKYCYICILWRRSVCYAIWDCCSSKISVWILFMEAITLVVNNNRIYLYLHR
jgi:hypothetical protein